MTHLDITFEDARYTHPEFTHIDHPVPGNLVTVYTSNPVLLLIELPDSSLKHLPEGYFQKTIITTGYATKYGENDEVRFMEYGNILCEYGISAYKTIGWCELPSNIEQKGDTQATNDTEDKRYYVIGGQYESYCYGGSDTLRGARAMATRHMEFWDNWQGYVKPRIYKAEDTKMIESKGRITTADGVQIRVPREFAKPID